MSTRHTESLLVKLMAEIDGSRARKELSRSKHMVNVREKDLAEAYKDAYNRVRAKDPSLPDPAGWKIFNAAAKEAIKRLRSHLSKGTVKAWETQRSAAIGSSSYITYISPRGYGPTRILKAVGVKYIDKKLKEFDRSLSTKRGDNRETSQASLFKTAVEFHHKGTTVGAAQLAQAFTFLEDTKYWEGFTQSAEITSLREIFGAFDLSFDVNPSNLSVKIKEDTLITGELGSYKKNYAGSELNDWKDIKPVLESTMRAWAQRQDWWNRPGSNTLAQDSEIAVEHVVMGALTQAKNAKAIKKTKKPKREAKKTKTRFPSKKSKFTGGGRKAVSGPATRSTASAPLMLLGVLNAQLPRVVEKNMGPPRLENRTGRFASSVKVTDIAVTAQGYPSIGYTYMTRPYGTFEVGGAQGSSSRDPRKLIDKSIREIAAQQAIGRFYTRRV